MKLLCKPTQETVGVSRYAEELAKQLDVKVCYTKTYPWPFRFLESYPFFLPRGDVHLTHHTFASGLWWKRGKVIVTVLDLVPLVTHFKNNSLFERIFFSFAMRNLKKADHIIAISEYTKQDLIKHLSIPAEKITVTPLGVDTQIFYPCAEKKKNTLLYVGSEDPRKNVEVVIKALPIVEEKIPDVQFRKVGTPQYQRSKELLALAKRLGVKEQVQFDGYVDDLPKTYAESSVFVMPSNYEGFGLPVLEAMACGTPVISSNTTSLPEVGGDAALYFNPKDEQALAEQIIKVLQDKELQETLTKKGLARAKEMSWEKTAKLTQEVYNAD